MRTIREFEERLHVDFARGDIPGFVHLYAGEEAAGTGIMMHLNRRRPHRQHAPRPRPLHRQGRGSGR
jgi:TPP-dependent pyruvate/acetoin dehydrogenase alpha subunit